MLLLQEWINNKKLIISILSIIIFDSKLKFFILCQFANRIVEGTLFFPVYLLNQWIKFCFDI